MIRSARDRIADVRRVLGAARASRSSETLAAELVRSTGLSPQGVRLALEEHLEVDATDDELSMLVDRAGDAACVTVILSANVFVGALRAIALARAAAPVVVVRPSTREPAFARALVEAAADPALTIADSVELATLRGEVHVYGRDETIAEVRAQTSAIVRGHGTGFGVALVTAPCAIESAAAAIARDVVPFDQRGCLSPRVVLAIGDRARARALGEAIHRELRAWERRVPRGLLSPEERAEAERYRAAIAFSGELFEGETHAVGLAERVTLPPAGRLVHIVACADEHAAVAALGGLAPFVTALGSDAARSMVHDAVPGARRSALGKMQRPPLDGPVDLRA